MFFFSGHVIIQGNEGVAQGLEQAAHNRLVVGSNPTALTRISLKYVRILGSLTNFIAKEKA